MPRIPTRTEPYDSPTRRQRHYRAKRDQTLRALGKASYVNGSHFAILLINSKGDVETYASEALQSLLSVWFPEEAKNQARAALAMAQENDRRRRFAAGSSQFSGDFIGDESVDGGDDIVDDMFEDMDSGMDATAPSAYNPVDLDISHEIPTQDFISQSAFPIAPSNQTALLQPPSFVTPDSQVQPIIPVTNSRFQSRRPPPLSRRSISQQTITNIIPAWQMEGHRLPRAALPPLPPQPFVHPISHDLYPTPPNSAPATMLSHSSVVGDPADPKIIALFPPFSETLYYSKFHNLQQKTCKIIARCWIKAIEPKKQLHFPYQGGDQTKPEWWPHALIHKEPDHLLKPQRNLLLITILRMRLVPVSALEASMAEVISSIAQDKLAILRSIYEMAKLDVHREEDSGLAPSQAPRDTHYSGSSLEDFHHEEEASPEHISTMTSEGFTAPRPGELFEDLKSLIASHGNVMDPNSAFTFSVADVDQLADMNALLNSNILSLSTGQQFDGQSQGNLKLEQNCASTSVDHSDIWSSIDSILQQSLSDKTSALDLALPPTFQSTSNALTTPHFPEILSAPPNLATFADRYGQGFREARTPPTNGGFSNEILQRQTFDMPVSIAVPVGPGSDPAGLSAELLSWSQLALPYLNDLQSVKHDMDEDTDAMPFEPMEESNSFSTVATEEGDHPTPSPQKDDNLNFSCWNQQSPETPLHSSSKELQDGISVSHTNALGCSPGIEQDQYLALDYGPRCLFPASPGTA